MKYRHSAVAGMFYPESCAEVKHYIAHFTKEMPSLSLDVVPRALIVPHAGYVYSGYTANLAYHYAASKCPDTKRVVVIGPSHRVYVAGASIALYESYHTPCGEIDIDVAYAHDLEKKFTFLNFNPQAHEEHSTEVQMPFIQHYFPNAKVVELVYGNTSYEELSTLIDVVLNDETILLVISTDLSHFYTQAQANKLDNLCINAISHLDLHALSHDCEACGITGIKAMAQSALMHNFQAHFLDYRTSYERTGDASRVVGYTSFLFG